MKSHADRSHDLKFPRRPAETFALACLVVLTFTAQAETRLAVASDGLTATGVTARGEVVFFGRSITYEGGVPVLARHAFTGRDDDGDGVVTQPVEEVSRYSTWVAVDLESGSYAVAMPEGATARLITLSPQEWRENDEAVDLSREYLDFLLVRPKKGAWALAVWQGGARDADDRNDDNLRLRTSAMEPLVGKDSPPPRAVKKDVIVIIDPRVLDIAVVTAD